MYLRSVTTDCICICNFSRPGDTSGSAIALQVILAGGYCRQYMHMQCFARERASVATALLFHQWDRLHCTLAPAIDLSLLGLWDTLISFAFSGVRG